MLGLLWMSVCGIGKFIMDAKEHKYNTEAREHRQTKYGTYYSRDCVERDVATNKPLKTTINSVGDIIQKSDYKTVTRNISEERRVTEFNQKKNDPNRKWSVYVMNIMDLHKEYPDKRMRDVWHIDYETGDVYVVKKLSELLPGSSLDSRWLECYMDIRTGKIVRVTDCEKERLNKSGSFQRRYFKTDKEVQDFIDRANSGDKKIKIGRFSYDRNIGILLGED